MVIQAKESKRTSSTFELYAVEISWKSINTNFSGSITMIFRLFVTQIQGKHKFYKPGV